MLRIFHYSPWYTYGVFIVRVRLVENLSLFALIYLFFLSQSEIKRWESFIIRLDILTKAKPAPSTGLRIFHYSPWYTYRCETSGMDEVENLSLFALIYLAPVWRWQIRCWESFIIRLDILNTSQAVTSNMLRIFHYSPWYTYYLGGVSRFLGWESFIIRLDILIHHAHLTAGKLRIFHYSPWYTYNDLFVVENLVENLSLFALIYLSPTRGMEGVCWESFIIRLDILNAVV